MADGRSSLEELLMSPAPPACGCAFGLQVDSCTDRCVVCVDCTRGVDVSTDFHINLRSHWAGTPWLGATNLALTHPTPCTPPQAHGRALWGAREASRGGARTWGSGPNGGAARDAPSRSRATALALTAPSSDCVSCAGAGDACVAQRATIEFGRALWGALGGGAGRSAHAGIEAEGESARDAPNGPRATVLSLAVLWSDRSAVASSV